MGSTAELQKLLKKSNAKTKDEGYLGNINVKRQGVSEEWDDEKVQNYLNVLVTHLTLFQNILKLYHWTKG